MSDAVVAISDDVYSLYYNPAGLGLLRRPELGTSYSRLHLGLTDKSDLSTSFLGYAHPLPGTGLGAVGASWNSFALGSLYREQAFGLSYGRGLGAPKRGLFAGGTFKFLHSGLGNLPEAGNAYSGIALTGQADPALSRRGQSTMDGDVGLLWRLANHYSLGLQAMHVSQPNVAFQDGQTDKLPLLLKGGFAYRSVLSNLVAQVDTQRAPTGGRDTRLTVGAERWFPRLLIGEFGARGGLAVGTRQQRQLTAGLSYRTQRMGLDYALSLPIGSIESTAGTHRMALSFRFGSAAEPEEAVELVLEAMRQLKSGGAASNIRIQGKGLSLIQKATVERYLAQGRALERQGRYREALDKVSVALSVSPAEDGLPAKYSRLNYVAQQIPALSEYKSDPVQSAMHQGILAYLAGKDDVAVSRLSAALRLKPKYKELAVFLAGLERITGQQRPALSHNASPPNYRLAERLTRADTAIQEGRYHEAIDLSLEVLRADETSSEAWQDLGTAYFALNDYKRSLNAWRRALSRETDETVKKDIRGYVRSVERAIKARPAIVARRPVVAALAAPPEKQRLSPPEVQALFDRAIERYTRRDLPEARRLLGTILDSDSENEEAKKALRRVEEELR